MDFGYGVKRGRSLQYNTHVGIYNYDATGTLAPSDTSMPFNAGRL